MPPIAEPTANPVAIPAAVFLTACGPSENIALQARSAPALTHLAADNPFRPTSMEAMVELSKIRERLEGLVAREAALRARDGGPVVAPAERVLERMEALRNTDQVAMVLRLGDEFHARLRELSGLERTSGMLARLLLSFERYRYLIGHDAVRVGELVNEHRRILEAIKSSDASAAESEMRRHVAAARKLYLRRLEPILVKASQREAS